MSQEKNNRRTEPRKRFEVSQKDLDILSSIPTKFLFEELSTREGVELKTVEPYQDLELKITGPAGVFIVID